ncbi:MAG: replicative DNA helicase [Gammaproteobacteria bacterium]|nr:MAG: replicative DNA helicase [Gammaproteobacteria bacterium]
MPELVASSGGSTSATDALKVPPHSVEAEQSVLGGLMIDNDSWDDVADIVVEQDFFRRDHRLIFRSIHDLAAREQPFDAVTLSEILRNLNELDDAGGLAYLGTLARNTPSAANIKSYATIVRENSVLRQLAAIGVDISNSAYNPEGRSMAELLDTAEQKVFQIAEQGAHGKHSFLGMKDLLVKVVDRIDTLYRSDSDVTGVSTGFNDLDKLTSGFQEGDLVIIAGRPSMGKTSFAMNIAEHVAINEKLPVAIFSMEMPGEQLVMRMLSSLGRINQQHLRTGRLDDNDWPRITSNMSILQEAPIFIDDTAALSPAVLRARARRLMRDYGKLGMIMVDYLQLMQIPGGSENRTNEISEISRNMKALAKELNVPVVCMSQLNRAVESRTDKRPMMADLRESGAIEQDADVIAFIYRDEVYNEDSPDKGKAEIIISKQRNGPIGTLYLTFQGQYTRFDNFLPENNYLEGYE